MLAITAAAATGKLLLAEDFSCASIGCNSTQQPTNYTRWRWSTTHSHQVHLHVQPASPPRRGNAVFFSVDYCEPPSPNPDHLGCYRSEFALQRSLQDTLIDWQVGVGSSERWFGFSNRLPSNYTWDWDPLGGPSLQIHGGGGLPELTHLHPVLNLQATSFNCPDVTNRTCPRWTVSVQSRPDDASIRTFDLGAIHPGSWDDWVVRARFSPLTDRGYLQVWRNGEEVLPLTHGGTAYNDSVPPYLKFGVYKGDWKAYSPRQRTATTFAIAYGAVRVGDEHSSFAEVSTAQKQPQPQQPQEEEEEAAAVGGAHHKPSRPALRPHLLLVVGDDMGSNDVGYSDPDVPTPNIDALARDGVRLSSLYTWNWCAPSRASLLTGRYAPKHGFESGGDGPEDNGDVHVLSTEFATLPQALKRAGYATVMGGKWHLGYATQAHLPENRGFDQYLGYLTGAEDYYTHVKSPVPACKGTLDLWNATPGRGGPAAIDGRYSTYTFTDFLVGAIERHPNASSSAPPLFVYASYQGVHGPLEVPKEYFDRIVAPKALPASGAGAASDIGRCSWEDYVAAGGKGFGCDGALGFNCRCNRLLVRAQMASLDDAVGNVTSAMVRRGLWSRTLMLMMGDNGGPTFEGHSNYPLRGGKLNFFEGGIRPAAFVHSPLLPTGSSRRGHWLHEMAHEVDVFATFVALAGADGLLTTTSKSAPAESAPRAAALGLPDGGGLLLSSIDGVNLWPALLDATAPPPRTEALLADHILRSGDLKLVAGADNASWTRGVLRDCMLGTGGGWLAPPTNATNLCPLDVYTRPPKSSPYGSAGAGAGAGAGAPPPASDEVCCDSSEFPGCKVLRGGDDAWLCSNPCTAERPCLYDLAADPAERHNVAAARPADVARMTSRLKALQRTYYVQTSRSVLRDNGRFCEAAKARGGWLGPWLD
jgi:arylsulfatase A-like enzyme